MKQNKPKVSLNIQHDYITLRTPNGNFTSSWSGYKATGKLAKHFDKFVDFMKKSNLKKGEAMAELAKEETLNQLFSGWDEIHTIDYKVGEMVVFSDRAFRAKYPSAYEVLEIKGKSAVIRVNLASRLRVDKTELQKEII